MASWPSCAKRVSLNRADAWRSRALTVRAMALLCLARLLVALVPFRLWRATLGHIAGAGDTNGADYLQDYGIARRFAAHVERAAVHLPFETKCLPRAMALAWMLRAKGLGYSLKLAVRPPQARSGQDDLHAWVEAGGTLVIGNLPGPWVVTLTLLA
jgi:Transglutaminase-like superfamily